MARGIPKSWASARITEELPIGKSGITITIWDKWGRTKRGTLVVSVGAVRWYPYKKKKPTVRLTWKALDRM